MAVPMCPGCRALLGPGEAVCPYCGWDLARTEVRRSGGLVERALRPLGGASTALLFANVLVAVVVAVVQVRRGRGGAGLDAWVDAILSPRLDVLVGMGANVPRWVLRDGQVWRLVAATFLHGGLLHIFFNLSALRNIGPAVEQAYGSGKALALYLLAGLAGSAGTLGWAAWRAAASPDTARIPSIGASGAILGYAGILVALGVRIGGEQGRALWAPLLKSVGFLLLLGVILALSRTGFQMDNAAHAGGFLFGLGAGFLCTFGVRARGSPAAVRGWDAAALVLAALVPASFVPAALALAR